MLDLRRQRDEKWADSDAVGNDPISEDGGGWPRNHGMTSAVSQVAFTTRRIRRT